MPSLLYQGSASQNQAEDLPDFHSCSILYQGWKKKRLKEKKKGRKKERKNLRKTSGWTDGWMGGKERRKEKLKMSDFVLT